MGRRSPEPRRARPTVVVVVLVAALVATACLPDTFTVNGCVFDRADIPTLPPDGPVYTVDCPGGELAGTHLSGLGLFLGSLAGADLRGANLTDSELYLVGLTGTDFSGAQMRGLYALGGVWIDTDLEGADLRGASFVEVPGERVDLTDADLRGARFDEVWWTDSDFTGTLIVPESVTVPATGPSGAVVTWPEPASIPEDENATTWGAVPGPCDHPSGSLFPIGVTEVRCEVLIAGATGNHGTFTVTVVAPP